MSAWERVWPGRHFWDHRLSLVATRSTKGRLTHRGGLPHHAPGRSEAMEILHPRCCGIDVHKASVCACISIKEAGVVEKHKRRFDTTTAQLRELVLWLQQQQVSKVAMEATGVYWKPVWNLLEEEFELLLVIDSTARRAGWLRRSRPANLHPAPPGPGPRR